MIPKTFDTARIMIWEGCAASLEQRLDSLEAEGVNIDQLAYADFKRMAASWRRKARYVRATLSDDLNMQL